VTATRRELEANASKMHAKAGFDAGKISIGKRGLPLRTTALSHPRSELSGISGMSTSAGQGIKTKLERKQGNKKKVE
jgi:hypothetical protein